MDLELLKVLAEKNESTVNVTDDFIIIDGIDYYQNNQVGLNYAINFTTYCLLNPLNEGDTENV